ncbi:DNA repair protein RadC [Acholeplasma equirhinis]|uniref:RadC family protein n=1 Tax=Acholeplasma equirhinis TaxID=555393 RepID=UPI00197A9F0A|nr:DNA repair protein RadC [Acholeplasma equirhinis]MBN3490656.1 DNA repair protein RadC [Acholeplasma equirhinis]
MQDLPREKLIKYGAFALDNHELIAILLRTGTKNENVLDLSLKVMNLFRHISYIKTLKLEDLMTVKGINEAKATTILAALELGRRIHEKSHNKAKPMTTTEDIYEFLKDEMELLEQEHLIVLTLDIKGSVLKKETVYIGTTTSITVSVKDLFKSAIKFGAYGIVMIHNHPTGDARPSIQDDLLTEKVKKASELLSVELIDHMIIGKFEYYSYKGRNLVKV